MTDLPYDCEPGSIAGCPRASRRAIPSHNVAIASLWRSVILILAITGLGGVIVAMIEVLK